MNYIQHLNAFYDWLLVNPLLTKVLPAAVSKADIRKQVAVEVIEVDPAYTSVIGMLKYAPQFMVSKDVAAAYVIARRGLGMKERIPHNYMLLLSRLDVNSLGELKEHIKKAVKSPNVRKRQLSEIDWAIKILQSSGSELGKASEPLDGTSSGVCGETRNLWRVLRVAVVTPPSWGRGYGFPEYRLLGQGKLEVADYKYPSCLNCTVLYSLGNQVKICIRIKKILKI